jgi:hypothetical protein
MRHVVARIGRLGGRVFKRSVFVAGLGLSMSSSVSAADMAVSENTFGCILDWPQVRNTRLKHSDPGKLNEAVRIFRDSIPNSEYPVGTILQLLPFEAMVKHPREKFPEPTAGSFSFWTSRKQAPRSKIGETVSSISRRG